MKPERFRLLRFLVLAEYAAVFFWLVWLPLNTPRPPLTGSCMDFRGVIAIFGMWPLFWAGMICLPSAVYGETLEEGRERRLRESRWKAAGASCTIFLAGLGLTMVPIGIDALFGVGLVVAFPGMFLPYLCLSSDGEPTTRNAPITGPAGIKEEGLH